MKREVKADELGRVCIPIDIRKALNIQHGDRMEFEQNSDGALIITKFNQGKHDEADPDPHTMTSQGKNELLQRWKNRKLK